MVKFFGKSVYKGIAIGPVMVLRKEEQQVKRNKVEDAEGEITRVGQAVEKAKQQLQKLYDKAVVEVGDRKSVV